MAEKLIAKTNHNQLPDWIDKVIIGLRQATDSNGQPIFDQKTDIESQLVVGETQQQLKYHLPIDETDNQTNYFEVEEKLQAAGAEYLGSVNQTDTYITAKGQVASYDSAYVRLRQQEFKQVQPDGLRHKYTLTIQNQAEPLEADTQARTYFNQDLNVDQHTSLENYFLSRANSYNCRQIRKTRYNYKLAAFEINIDENLRPLDRYRSSVRETSQQPAPATNGLFLEIKSNQSEPSQQSLQQLASDVLAIKQPADLVTYANIEYFLDKYPQSIARAELVRSKRKPQPFDFVYHHRTAPGLVVGEDCNRYIPAKVLASLKQLDRFQAFKTNIAELFETHNYLTGLAQLAEFKPTTGVEFYRRRNFLTDSDLTSFEGYLDLEKGDYLALVIKSAAVTGTTVDPRISLTLAKRVPKSGQAENDPSRLVLIPHKYFPTHTGPWEAYLEKHKR